MSDWNQRAFGAISAAIYGGDPEAVPDYFVPNRRWWFQFWKPKWRLARGVSVAQLQRAHNAMIRDRLDRL